MWTNLLWLALGILAGATLTLAVTPCILAHIPGTPVCYPWPYLNSRTL